MQEYVVEVYRREDIPSQNDFWGLHRKYEGHGFSDSQFNDELLGKYFNIFIKSDKILNLDDLQEEFPSINIAGLKPNSSN